MAKAIAKKGVSRKRRERKNIERGAAHTTVPSLLFLLVSDCLLRTFSCTSVCL